MAVPALPLLHVLPATAHVARVTEVDPLMLLTALAGMAAVAFLVWAPRPLSVARLSRWRAARAVIAIMIVFAVLPSVVPYDHLLPGLHHDATVAQEAAHETHCHLTPGSCADAPISAGPGQFIFSEPLILAPALLAVLLFFSLPAMTGIAPRPEVRPPVV